MKNEILIRKGKAEDMAAVHKLIYELALYENAPEEVKTSPEIFTQDGFGERSLFECFVAETPDQEIIGVALFYFGYSTWKGKKLYLDDLVITESYRKKGVGQMLMDRLFAYAKEKEVQRISWVVLDWNEPAIKFYKKIQAKLDKEWITCVIEKSQIDQYVPGGTYRD